MAKKKKKKKKKHFSGWGVNDLHTGRTPRCYRGGQCDYQNVGRQGKLASYRKLQDHHVLPVGMLIHYQIEDEYKPCRQEFDKIYRAQDYCANNKDNLMWLPTKPTYLKHKKASPVWDLDLPCHTINHPPYNEEVLVELRGRVWDLIKEAVDDKKCLDPPDVVVQQLLGLESHFQGLVTQRGKRPPPSGGTRFAVDNIKKHPQWWHAFSMADAPDATPAVKFFYETEVPRAMRRK